MSRLIITRAAAIDIKHCCDFLREKNPKIDKFELLTLQPNMGRIVKDEMRELVILFGTSGYIALYRYDLIHDSVYVLAFRHQKEAGFN